MQFREGQPLWVLFFRYFKRKEEIDVSKKGKKRELVEDINVDGTLLFFSC